MSNHDAYHIYCLSSTIQVFTKLIIAKSYCRLLPPLICLLDWGPFLSSSNGCFSPFIGHQIWSNLHSYEWVVDLLNSIGKTVSHAVSISTALDLHIWWQSQSAYFLHHHYHHAQQSTIKQIKYPLIPTYCK